MRLLITFFLMFVSTSVFADDGGGGAAPIVLWVSEHMTVKSMIVIGIMVCCALWLFSKIKR